MNEHGACSDNRNIFIDKFTILAILTFRLDFWSTPMFPFFLAYRLGLF